MKEPEKTLRRYYEPLSRDPGIIYMIPFIIDYVNYVKREPLLHSLIENMQKGDLAGLKSGLSECWEVISSVNTELIKSLRGNFSTEGMHREIGIKVAPKRIHNYLLEEIPKSQNGPSLPVKAAVRFDEKKSMLFIGNKGVGFRKFTEQYHTLRIVLGSASRLADEWFFSDIREKLDEAKDYTDKDFHNYFSAIKRRVAAETGIKDLFITTTQSVRINPDYLKS